MILASHLAISRRNFDRRFVKATGNTPVEYLQRVKVEAAKKELDDRKNRFEKFKAFYCDKTKFSDFTKNDLSKVCEWISNGYEEIKGAGVLAYENISEQMNLFLYAMGYFSTYDKDTVGYNLADKGWKAVEYYLYNIDVEKSQAAWEDFKTYYNDNLGKIMYPIK